MDSEVYVHGNNISATVKDIPVIFPLPGTPNSKTEVSDLDMGMHDFPAKIQYINTHLNNLPSANNSAVEEMKEMLDITFKWLDVHAGKMVQVAREKGYLTGQDDNASRLKRDEYRAKVIDTILNEGKCGWLGRDSHQTRSSEITVSKIELHTEIVRRFLSGITTVSGISETIEKTLEAIADVILECKSQAENSTSWSFINTSRQNPNTGETEPYIRIIWYAMSGDVVYFILNKPLLNKVHLKLTFHQADFRLIQGQWIKAKPHVEEFLDQHSVHDIHDPIDGNIMP